MLSVFDSQTRLQHVDLKTGFAISTSCALYIWSKIPLQGHCEIIP